MIIAFLNNFFRKLKSFSTSVGLEFEDILRGKFLVYHLVIASYGCVSQKSTVFLGLRHEFAVQFCVRCSVYQDVLPSYKTAY